MPKRFEPQVCRSGAGNCESPSEPEPLSVVRRSGVSFPRLETRVLLVRHGKTSDPDRFHGAESNIGLSAWGTQQAEQLGLWLKGAGAQALYSSGLRRAVETAVPIGRACGSRLKINRQFATSTRSERGDACAGVEPTRGEKMEIALIRTGSYGTRRHRKVDRFA